MPAISQTDRFLSITSPLGPDALILTSFRGHEQISRPFHFQLDLASENMSIQPADLIGLDVTWIVQSDSDAPRYFHGRVARLAIGGASARELRGYRAEVVPWLWFLSQASGCRIYQNKSVTDIVKAIFGQFGFDAFEWNATGATAVREYCVQYRESYLDFVHRLLEDEGLFYYFRHEDGKHTMVVGDAATHFEDSSYSEVLFRAGELGNGLISGWEHQFAYCPGKWAATDYNFETPKTSLLTSTDTIVTLPGISSYERYDYPGGYKVKADGDPIVARRMGEEEMPYDTIQGTSACRDFSPGRTFTLAEHEFDAENQKFALTVVDHQAVDPSVTGGGGQGKYSNSFVCIPATIRFVPPRETPRPTVKGPHTAVVVGPSGEEIYVDKYGRIRVQFHWDREGKNNETSSCFVRVAQTIAGAQWGSFFHPRIGQEVIVEFLEGDPDKPLVTGSVYNATNMPPYALPENMTKSGFKSRSSKGGGAADFNELYFEDKKGAEVVYFHAQKNFQRVVEFDDDTKVMNDQKITVSKNRIELVEQGNDAHTVAKGNLGVTVSAGALAVLVSKGAFSLSAGNGNCVFETAEDKFKLVVEKSDALTEITKGKHDLTVKKGSHGVTISEGDSTFTVTKGGFTEVVNSNYKQQVKQGNRTVSIDMGNEELTIKMGNQTTKVSLGKSSTEAMQAIELKVGQSSIKIDQAGVTIKGLIVKVQGTVQTEVSALMTKLAGTAMCEIKGGVTMIN